MSTDLKSPAPATPESREADKPKLDLSVAQIVGGALAAMTAAFLGSRLSVAGTVVGAALASIVAAVAGNVYTASLRTTHARVRTVFQGKVAGTDMPASVTEVGAGPVAPSTSPAAPAAPRTVGARLSVRNVVLAALAAFALAAAVLTGVELATGRALSGGDGTTITQVTEERRTTPTKDPGSEATVETPSPSSSAPSSATASDSPVPTPSEQPSTPAPVPTPSASAEPPTPTASDTGSSAPSPAPSDTPEAPDSEG